MFMMTPTILRPLSLNAASAVTLNPADTTAGITLSNGNLTAQWASSTQGLTRATKGFSSADVYFEVACEAFGAELDVGFVPLSAAVGDGYPGGPQYPSVGLFYNQQGSGRIIYNGSQGAAFSVANGSAIGLLYRASNKTFYLYAGGSLVGSVVTTLTGALYPAMKGYSGERATVNFGATAFTNPLPSGGVRLIDAS